MICSVRFNGSIHKIKRYPQETDEHAQDRVWYAAKNLSHIIDYREKECLSRAWANEKYFGISYKKESE